MSILKNKKKLKFYNFLYICFYFLELKHDVKNEYLENVILVRESEKNNFLCIFLSNFLQKKKLFSLSSTGKSGKNKKLECVFFFTFPIRLGGGVYYETHCITFGYGGRVGRWSGLGGFQMCVRSGKFQQDKSLKQMF